MSETATKRASPELREFVEGVATKYREQVNATPGLLSTLYDVDLLPEQLGHVLDVNPGAARVNAYRMSIICELWSRAYSGINVALGEPER